MVLTQYLFKTLPSLVVYQKSKRQTPLMVLCTLRIIKLMHSQSSQHTHLQKSLVFCWERKSWTNWLLTGCSKKGWAAETGQGLGKIPPSGPATNPISHSLTALRPTGWPPLKLKSAAVLPGAPPLLPLPGVVKGLLCHPSFFHGVLHGPDTPAQDACVSVCICICRRTDKNVNAFMRMIDCMYLCVCVCRIQGSSFLLVPCCTSVPQPYLASTTGGVYSSCSF